MATFSLLFKTPRANGERKVYIRVCHRGDVGYIPTNYYVLTADILKGGKLRNTCACKMDVDEDLLTAQQAIKSIGSRVRAYTVKDVAKAVALAIDRARDTATNDGDFIAYGYMLAERKSTTSKTTAEGYRYALSAIERFYGDELPFTSLTKRWLLGFEAHLRKRGVGQSTIATYMRRIRAIHRQAQAELNDEELGALVVPFDPFKTYKIPAEVTQVERTMPIEHIRRIANYEPRTEREQIGKDAFLLSLQMLGINALDLYTVAPAIDGRITYRRHKVAERKGAAATISVKVIPEVLDIATRYATPCIDRAFNFSERYNDIEHFRKAINRGMKSICESLGIPVVTFYYARHAFAQIAHQELGYSLDDIAKCLCHSSATRSITFRYAGVNYKLIDEIQRGVVDFIRQAD